MNNEDQFYIDLGNNISSVRNKRNIGQEKLANFLKLSRPSITNIEKGRQKPTILTLVLIANYLHVNISELIPNINNLDVNNITFRGTDTLNEDSINNESLNNFLRSLIKKNK